MYKGAALSYNAGKSGFPLHENSSLSRKIPPCKGLSVKTTPPPVPNRKIFPGQFHRSWKLLLSPPLFEKDFS